MVKKDVIEVMGLNGFKRRAEVIYSRKERDLKSQQTHRGKNDQYLLQENDIDTISFYQSLWHI